MEGWIKIHRGLLDWEWYSDTNCVRMALHLLLMANFQTKRWRGITVERGQLVTSRSILARETGLSEREVRTAISKLEKSDFMTSRATSSYTIVTICNYEKYQSPETVERPAVGPTDDQDATNCRPSVDQPATTTEECKKVRREEYTHTVSSEKGVAGGETAEGPGHGVQVIRRGGACGGGVDGGPCHIGIGDKGGLVEVQQGGQLAVAQQLQGGSEALLAAAALLHIHRGRTGRGHRVAAANHLSTLAGTTAAGGGGVAAGTGSGAGPGAGSGTAAAGAAGLAGA